MDYECCENCYYEYNNQCRRFPPTFLGRDKWDGYPTVNASDWCGEYKPQVSKSEDTRKRGAE